MAVFVDSDVAIQFLRGNGEAARRIGEATAKQGPLYLPSIVLFEVGNGLSGHRDKNTFGAFAAKTIVVPFGDPEARTGSGIYQALRKKGKMIGIGDVMIAATAIANSQKSEAYLLTDNRKDFGKISGLYLV